MIDCLEEVNFILAFEVLVKANKGTATKGQKLTE